MCVRELFFLSKGFKRERKMKSLFVVNVRLPEEYRDWINDMVKTFILLATIHVLQYATRNGSSSRAGGLFNVNFWKLMVFAAVGFSAYYLVVRKLVRFRYVGEHDRQDDGQSPHGFNMSPLGVITNLRQWLKNKL